VSGTLVGGIGNVFLGDDGFGVEVVRRLAGKPTRTGVHIADFGIRSIDLAYALLDEYDDVILVDAMPRGKAPGTLYVLEPWRDGAESPTGPTPGLAAHGFVPTQVLALAAELSGSRGRKAARIRIVGCEPGEIPADGDIQVGLSAPVAAAVDRAVDLVEQLVGERGGHA
jgi:hydrogenase maturation protease